MGSSSFLSFSKLEFFWVVTIYVLEGKPELDNQRSMLFGQKYKFITECLDARGHEPKHF